jgi:Mpv17 / PMP22 family
MSTFFATWFRLSKQYPVTFNSLTGGSLCACSDILAQYLESNNKKLIANNHNDDMSLNFRIRRVASAGLIGVFFGGWVYPAAYARLDAMWKGTHLSAVVQKSIVEIMTVGIFVNSVSMTSRGLLMGRDNRQVVMHVATEMPTVTFNDARVWFPYNIVAFSLIPVTIRPTTTLMMEAGWQTYISIMSNNYDEQEVTPATTVKGTTKTPVEHTESRVIPVGFQAGGVVIATSPR